MSWLPGLTLSRADESEGSLDRDARERSEHQAWEMLYNQDQRTILEKALAAINRAVTMPEKIDETLVTGSGSNIPTEKGFHRDHKA